ncbi:MAG: phytoene desaturase family protein [bacterium]
MYDVIIIGSGIGGISCAARLAKNGLKVLVLEKAEHIGGTSFVFNRGLYSFPMGPLSFGYYKYIEDFFKDIGIDRKIEYKRNHFQLVSPFLNIIYSSPLDILKEKLKEIFPKEKNINVFFTKMEDIIASTRDINVWHPDYRLDSDLDQESRRPNMGMEKKIALIDEYSRTPSRNMIDSYFSDPVLKNLLGSQGTTPPFMSVLNLAFMWNIVSSEGIWFPSCGIHGLNNLAKDVVLQYGGSIKLRSEVKEIILEKGRAVGVKTKNRDEYASRWVVSNADYKKTFLHMVDLNEVPTGFIEKIKKAPYTGTEVCVYLGIDPKKVDLGAMKAAHFFYRHRLDPSKSDPEDFENREIEICLWSENAPDLVPENKIALVLRAGFPYEHIAHFRTGAKKRRDGYKGFKDNLTNRLIAVAENVIPGLFSAIDRIESATPLTYEDWGGRYRGSIAGWTWSFGYQGVLGKRLLVRTPVKNLLMVGIYASSELFMGGMSTAVFTARCVSDWIIKNMD